jgi:hypothetical protein
MAFMAVCSPVAFALITGGEGNTPLNDPGWPKGAITLFNVTSRIAWWEGPPFGGGQWHAECRGDAHALNEVLAGFARLDIKSKHVVLHDGVGQSFWLNPNNEPAKREAARMDWRFMVWQTDNWKRLSKLPADLNPTGGDEADGPPTQLDIYTGGNIKWANVLVPKGLKVDDQRLEAHGFKPTDGVVLEGKITDLASQKPLAGKMRLEKIEPQTKGGYRYTTMNTVNADAAGHWVLKNTPGGWLRVVIEAEGFVPRVVGHLKTDDQPRWQAYDSGLAHAAKVAGRVTDGDGKPLADVEVRFANVATNAGARYESAFDQSLKTDTDGRFQTDQIPVGKATIWLHKPGYCRPGLGQSITTPSAAVELSMSRAGRIVVTIDFAGKQRPPGYIVNLEPEGGNVVGSFGGSGQINDKNEMAFENIPPGRYVVHGRPNPGSERQRTEAVTIDLKGGQMAEMKLKAK